MDAEALKSPWVWGAGLLIGVVLVMRSRGDDSGPNYAPLIATNALAAQTSVQLSGIQAQVIDSNNARLAQQYAVDGAVTGKIIDGNTATALRFSDNKSKVQIATLQKDLGIKSLDTTLEAHKLAADVAKTQADYKFRVDSVYAANAPATATALATISTNATLQAINRQSAASENIARINADSRVNSERTRADSDMFGDVLGVAKSALPFFF